MRQNTSAASLSEEVGQYASRYDMSGVSKEGVLRAKLSILDATGVALASTRHDFAHKTLSAVIAMGDRGDGVVLGLPGKLSIRDAMLVNGALIHGIDYDDTHMWGGFHPTASAFTCALGTAQHLGLGGRDLLAAYILGVEVMVRVGSVAPALFQPEGFHSTGVVGAFGCSVAAGWLMGLGAAQLAHAQGIVLSAASGSMEFLAEGSWTKRLHAGQAAVAGFQAAAFAKQGYIGPRLPYEGRFGLYNLHFKEKARDFDFSRVTAELGTRWHVEGLSVKPYPACHYTHSTADAVFALMKDSKLQAKDIERITVKLPAEQMSVVCEPVERKRRPVTGYEAKFSIPYSVAICLLTGRHGLNEFDDERLLTRPDVLELCDKVDCEADPVSNFPIHFSSDVTVTLKNGERLHNRQKMNRGCPDLPLTPDEVKNKFMENAGLVLNERKAALLRDCIMDIEGCDDLHELARLVAGTGAHRGG